MRARLSLIVALLALVAMPLPVAAADAAVTAYGGPLTGAQEVPPVATAATGEGTAVVSRDGSTITYIVTYAGLSGPVTAAHIHTGAAGVAGGVILPLVAGPSPMVGTLTAANFTASGAVTTFAQAVAAIQAGTTYFNLHTAANAAGEIRGQIVAKGDAFFATLAGFQEIPPVTTAAIGSAFVIISPDSTTLTYYVSYSGLSGALTASHIHTGAVGVNGGVILPLVAGPSPMSGTLTAANFTASGPIADFAGAVAAIRAGTTYVNLHTAANAAGEIRGQLAVTVAAPVAPTASPVVTAPPTSTGDAVPPAAGGSGLGFLLTVLAAITVTAHPRLREVLVRRR